MDELMKRETLTDNSQPEGTYHSIRDYVSETQGQVYTAMNAAVVAAY